MQRHLSPRGQPQLADESILPECQSLDGRFSTWDGAGGRFFYGNDGRLTRLRRICRLRIGVGKPDQYNGHVEGDGYGVTHNSTFFQYGWVYRDAAA